MAAGKLLLLAGSSVAFVGPVSLSHYSWNAKLIFFHTEAKYGVDSQDFHVGIWNLKNLFSSSFCQASKEEELGDA